MCSQINILDQSLASSSCRSLPVESERQTAPSAFIQTRQTNTPCVFADVTPSPRLSPVQMFASAKSLFISDQDKRKHFCLLLRLFLGNKQEVGSFPSRMIKVISKPSQKRQSMKNADCEARFSTSSTCSPLYEPQKHFIVKIFTLVELHFFEVSRIRAAASALKSKTSSQPLFFCSGLP